MPEVYVNECMLFYFCLQKLREAAYCYHEVLKRPGGNVSAATDKLDEIYRKANIVNAHCWLDVSQIL